MTSPTTTPTSSAAPEQHGLPAATRLGPVELTVTDLDRSVAFYGDVIGLSTHGQEAGEARLGTGGEDVLVLREDARARPAGRHAGLYHVALLYPSRLELARAAMRIAVARTPIQGASDHVTHEAIYLADPDGNGLELAADRPRDQWPPMDRVYGAGPLPLDTDALFALAQETPVPARAQAGLAVGHMHLHVGDLAAAQAFYVDALGFDLIADLGTAVFVSAGGYHHHVAFNVWRGKGVPPQPEGTVGLGHFAIVVPDAEAVASVGERLARGGVEAERLPEGLRVHDPSGNTMVITAEAQG